MSDEREIPEKDIRDIANALNGFQPTLGQWQRDLRLARRVERLVLERFASVPAEPLPVRKGG